MPGYRDFVDHYSEAERLFPPKLRETTISGRDLAIDAATAQVHATLAVADQLAKIAAALEKLGRRQEGPSSE